MHMSFIAFLATLGFLIIAIFLIAKYKNGLKSLKANHEQLLQKYGGIIDLEDHKAGLKKELESLQTETYKLKDEYKEKKVIYEALLKDIALYEEQLEITSYGLYKPHYDFQTSEQYKDKLEEIRKREKLLIQDERAFLCKTEWRVNNSVMEGRRQTKQYGKLMLRAFNGECDALISNVRWNNVVKMEERLAKSFEIINKLGTVHQIEITKAYNDLKLEELRLTYEYDEKRHQEKEEQRRIQEQIREEEKVQRDIEKAKKEAEDEEKRYGKALEQARTELASAQGNEAETLNNQIAVLEGQLKEALEKKERAISQAQLTKSGHVYVISNIGSLGEDIYKIGLTRRLEPLDRVRELGDASVPFEYDIHAMIHSDNAPELEYNIHRQFEDRRLNLLNNRKEFFRATLDEIEKVVKQYRADIELTKIAEAREYRESQAMREQMKIQKEGFQEAVKAESKYPESI